MCAQVVCNLYDPPPCRHGDRQHAGVGSAGGGRAREGEGGHDEAPPPSEREEAEQPDPAGSILR